MESPESGGGMVGRIQRILLQPKSEFTAIDSEPATVQGLITGWAVPLAAIAPVCHLIGGQVFGYGIMGLRHAGLPIAPAVILAVVSYGLALLSVFILSLLIDALAPSFGGVRDRVQATKAAVYSSVAAWLAGIFQLLPALAILGIVGLYSLYLLYVALPILMKAPQDRAIGYIVVIILLAIVMSFVVSGIVGAISASMFMSAALI